tara:strand:- start:15998 stop:16279 length:282 start_codon:yes stop_codon:yes gene_type:complete
VSTGADCKVLIAEQLRAIFIALKAGQDVSPAQHYRAEGFMQAAMQLAAISEVELLQLQQRVQQEVYGDDRAHCDSENMQAGRLQLNMAKAPVK